MGKYKDTWTGDLFDQVFPIRKPVAQIDSVNLSGRISRLVSLILKESQQSREQVAAAMSEMLGCPNFSKAMLDNYSSESNAGHKITLERFIVLVRVTGTAWAWDELLRSEGLTVLYGEEVRLAKLGALKQQQKEIQRELNSLLKMEPVNVTRGRK
jgi:hypothetical protein|nr:MAG TPA: regulatory protein [Caudoviricetes sp.]